MKKLAALLCSIIVVFGIAMIIYLNFSEWREFLEPLQIPLECENASIVIKEWQYLLGSGADIYYKDSGGRETKIGTAGGGDDGYTPFENDQYDVEFSSDTVIFRWYFGNGDPENSSSWRSKELLLP